MSSEEDLELEKELTLSDLENINNNREGCPLKATKSNMSDVGDFVVAMIHCERPLCLFILLYNVIK